MAKPRSLVTGACGFIGSHVVEALAAAGHEVIATDVASAWETADDKRRVNVEAVRASGAAVVPSDVTDPRSLERLPADVDYIFHVASVFSYSASWDLLQRVNVQGAKNMIALALADKKLKRFVLWGAGGIYGLPERQEMPLREDVSLPDPSSDYLRSKWQQEFYTMQMGLRHGLPYTIVRPTTVYGPRGFYGGGQLLMAMASSNPMAMPANFTGRIPFVHVRDVAGAAVHLAAHEGAAMQVFNVNDDSTLQTIEFARFMASLMGHPFITLPPIPHMAIRRVAKTVAALENFVTRDLLRAKPLIEADGIDYLNGDFLYSNEKLKATGYTFLYPDPRPGIQETVQWFMRNGWMKKPRLNIFEKIGLAPAPKPL